MRIFLYLLAMLTGFSAAEAARPVSAVPAAVDAAAAQAYAATAVKAAEQVQLRPVPDAPLMVALSSGLPVADTVTATTATTPVIRHDVIRA